MRTSNQPQIKKDIMILSTFHKGKEQVKVLRRKEEVNIPKHVDDCNKKWEE
jgi:hypothetical protein